MRYVAAIDEGTLSARCIIFSAELQIMHVEQLAHRQITPQAGWLEHDPVEIYENCCKCLARACEALRRQDPTFTQLDAVGITNQRETTVVWDSVTGAPLYNAIVWSDARTTGVVAEVVARLGKGNADFAADVTGLPASIYFSAFKLRWLLTHVPAVQAARAAGTLRAGTIDTWLMWRLSRGEAFVTDVTNASRFFLMDLRTRAWDTGLCDALDLPRAALPAIRSCSERLCVIREPGFGLPAALGGETAVTGCLGDQQAALVGNLCLAPGEAECTYGTGCFLLMHVGATPRPSRHRLLSTVAYQLGPTAPCQYALEAAIANAGATMDWMARNLGWVREPAGVEAACRRAGGSEGVVFVPAFGGLFAPYWDAQARGTVLGITYKTTKAHVMYAALEAIAMQVHDNLEAMARDSGVRVRTLKVNGGLTKNRLLMEIQANVLDTELRVPRFKEMTSLGAALCAGLAVGTWANTDAIRALAKTALPADSVRPSGEERAVWTAKLADWHRAIERARWAKL